MSTVVAIILFLIFFGGNVALFSGDIEGVEFAVVIAVIADIGIVIWILSKWAESIERKNEQQRLAKLAEIEKSIRNFWEKYEPKNIPAGKKEPSIFSKEYMPNAEIVECVKKYKQNNEKIYHSLSVLYDKVYDILQASKSYTDKKECLAFLNENSEELSQLKLEIDSLEESLNKTKIKLLSDTTESIKWLKGAFVHLKISKKLSNDKNTPRIGKLLEDTLPADLKMFEFDDKYDSSPLTLHFARWTFCFFEKAILVFDLNGNFYTALDPSALELEVTRLQSSITVHSGNVIYNEFIDTDSKCIQRGVQYTTWVHTCRDGSPDLRYSYNPRIDYRTDIMEYGIIELKIYDYNIKYTTSSSKTLDAMEQAKKTYCQSYKQYHNPIPSLLNLFDLLLDDKKQTIVDIRSKCSANNEGYFCKIVDVE